MKLKKLLIGMALIGMCGGAWAATDNAPSKKISGTTTTLISNEGGFELFTTSWGNSGFTSGNVSNGDSLCASADNKGIIHIFMLSKYTITSGPLTKSSKSSAISEISAAKYCSEGKFAAGKLPALKAELNKGVETEISRIKGEENIR